LSGSLPSGTVNQNYNAVLAVGGGNSPYRFAVKSGTLPPGVSLNAATGALSGQPTTAGSYSFEVMVTDPPRNDQGSRAFGVMVADSKGGVHVSISPTSATLSSSQKQQFTATITGTSKTGVTWSATVGTIDANGLYTAPPATSQINATVTATSKADTTKSASAAVVVNPVNGQSLQITTGGLPQGQKGSAYDETFTATGGTTPYSWSVSAGTLPPGLAMSTGGDVSGTPTKLGTFNFTVTVTDANNKKASGDFGITVASGSGYDGPAQLPIANVPHAMSQTPAPGSVIAVNAGADLQSALNSTQCGNTIELQAGATFTGTYTLPAKNCDNSHWIIIRTNAPDSALPAEGQRVTPCYAGVASLQGRPQYSCNKPQNVLAKLVVSTGSGPVVFASGANHYRLIGLEVTRPTGTKGAPALIAVETGGTASNIIVDRSWVHGTPHDEARAGVEFGRMTSAAVVDSYFSDFHCTSSTGTCTDAHAVAGGTDETPGGPYEIVNNFLEASGEAVMFGGGSATVTPTDITIRSNHFFKPWEWMPGNHPFVGGDSNNPFIVKNHLELKNAVRVLIENNLMENVWGGFSQNGFGILLTPKNQHTQKHGNVCPLCEVTDVTIRYTRISHAGGGIVMATVTSGNGSGGGSAKAGARISIHDVVMDDISKNYTGLGRLFLIANSWTANPLNTMTISHISGFPDADGGFLIMGDKGQNPQMYGFVMANSIVITGKYPVWNVGGGDTSCAHSDIPVKSISQCFTTYTFGNNLMVGAPSKYDQSAWPSGTLLAADPSNVGFVKYNDGNGGNYELQPSSPYKNKGTDGKDLGADIAGLNEALANVE
jgi:hypothetical protein